MEIMAGKILPYILLAALDGRSEEMARRAFDIFGAVFPEPDPTTRPFPWPPV